MISASRRSVMLATVLTVLIAGCAQPEGGQRAPVISSVTATPVSTGVSNGKAYTVDRSTSEGAPADGSAGHWSLTIETLSGGDPRVTETFNDAVHAAAQRLLDDATAARTAAHWTFETSPRIFFAPASVSALISATYMVEGADHPIGSVLNVVVDSRSGRQITLKELFVDDQAGLNRLAEQTKMLLPPAMGVTATPMPNHPGNKPLLENFDSWIPTPAGLEIHFADHQFVAGTPVITVPWSAIDDLLEPGMKALRQA